MSLWHEMQFKWVLLLSSSKLLLVFVAAQQIKLFFFFLAYQVAFCCMIMQYSTLCRIKAVCTEIIMGMLFSTPFLHR